MATGEIVERAASAYTEPPTELVAGDVGEP
jgi:hypothetical protein